MNNLVGGLITEVGALNFPPGGATSTENCIWTQKKTVKRRLGFNFETDFTPITVGPVPAPPDARFYTDIGVSQGGGQVIITDGIDVFFSADSGVTFHNAVPNGGGPHNGITGCDISPDGSILGVSVGSAGTENLWISLDFGASWFTVSAPGLDWLDISFGVQTGSTYFLAVEQTNFHVHTYNFGSPGLNDLGDIILNGNPSGIIPSRIYAAASSGGVLGATFLSTTVYSGDYGVNWQANDQAQHISTWGAISADGSQMHYIGDFIIGDQWLYESSNAGASWGLTEPTSYTPVAICCDSITGTLTYIGDNRLDPSLGSQPGQIWKNGDLLSTSPLLLGCIPCCNADGNIVVVVSSSNGVWYSHDAGDNWAQSSVFAT